MALCKWLVLATITAAASMGANAQQLNVICSVQAEWCTAAANEFQRSTGVKVGLTLKGSGESMAQLAAEKANPKLDVWFGGTGDPHLQAAEQDLTQQYRSPMLEQLQPWAKRQAEQSGYKTVGIYLGALGLGYNTELLAKKKLPAPMCWKDLARPEYAGDVQMANPNASGTAYTAIATLVQLFGEEEAFKLLTAMHKNISQYARQGVGPIKATARGENLVAVAFIHDVITEAQAGFPVKSVAPCEGTGYEIGSLSIVKGARNLEAARKFVDWALTPQAQALGAQAKQFQIPSNVNAPISPLSPKVAEIKLINYDFAKYGLSAERKRLLERWDREVASLPR
ncbi:MAG: ABC transporter substrate-binding protein [Pseudomonadota bacterium]|nr:ABC transporter substrate-binding protein [Pseudomonadota bacterium]